MESNSLWQKILKKASPKAALTLLKMKTGKDSLSATPQPVDAAHVAADVIKDKVSRARGMKTRT